jgi:hypothetical protein
MISHYTSRFLLPRFTYFSQHFGSTDADFILGICFEAQELIEILILYHWPEDSWISRLIAVCVRQRALRVSDRSRWEQSRGRKLRNSLSGSGALTLSAHCSSFLPTPRPFRSVPAPSRGSPYPPSASVHSWPSCTTCRRDDLSKNDLQSILDTMRFASLKRDEE